MNPAILVTENAAAIDGPLLTAGREGSRPSAGKYKSSRYNAHTTSSDGTLILANTYTGAICAIPPPGVAHVKQYLARVAGHQKT